MGFIKEFLNLIGFVFMVVVVSFVMMIVPKCVNESCYASGSSNNMEEKFNLARTYDQSGRYIEAVKIYEELAEKGYMPAKSFFGYCLVKGKGVAQDKNKGVKYLKEASDCGDKWGRYYLGWCYLKGLGVERDKTKAFGLFELASKQDLPLAKYCLGECYLKGIGVYRDLNKAKELLREAADLGISEAKADLEKISQGNTW